jgi:ABC-type phosphate/phosphonate transport system substrate-binding protein
MVKKNIPGWMFLSLALCYILFSLIPGQSNLPKEKIFKMGYSTSIFQDIDPRDGNAAVYTYAETFRKKIKKERNLEVIFDSYVFNSIDEISDALKKRQISFIGLATNEYFLLQNDYKLIPCLASTTGDDVFSNYILIVNKESNIKDLKSLNGKTLALPSTNLHPLIKIWLSNLLHQKGLELYEKFFKKINSYDKESNTVHSVFFKNNDCGVVRLNSFTTLCELNPQLKKSIDIIEVSPKLLLSISCYSKGTDPELLNIMIAESQKLHRSASGKQILSVFKIEKVMEINENDLITTKQMYDYYQKNIRKKNPRTTAGNKVK